MVMPYRQLVQKAVAEGFEVHSIWDPALETPDYIEDVAKLSKSLALVDFRDEGALRRVVRELAATHAVEHVLHLGHEATQLPVCEAAHALGLALNSPSAVARLNDKSLLRRTLGEHQLSPVHFVEAASPGEAVAALEALEPPLVVKPTRLDGSRGVRLIRNKDELRGWAGELQAAGYSGPVLAEEYLDGPEYSVEVVSAAGRHHVVGITAKRKWPPPGYVELGHLHPAPLAEPDRTAIVQLTTQLLDAVGYRFGPSHTEVILTLAGPRIVESQARLGGDRIPLLIELATGFDIEAAIFQALAGKTLAPPPAQRLGAITFFDAGQGRVESVAGLEEIEALPFVHAVKFKYGPGDTLPPVTDSGSRHGYVVVDAESEAQAARRLSCALDLLRVAVEPAGDRLAATGIGSRNS
jgi:biotin carboxylase